MKDNTDEDVSSLFDDQPVMGYKKQDTHVEQFTDEELGITTTPEEEPLSWDQEHDIDKTSSTNTGDNPGNTDTVLTPAPELSKATQNDSHTEELKEKELQDISDIDDIPETDIYGKESPSTLSTQLIEKPVSETNSDDEYNSTEESLEEESTIRITAGADTDVSGQTQQDAPGISVIPQETAMESLAINKEEINWEDALPHTTDGDHEEHILVTTPRISDNPTSMLDAVEKDNDHEHTATKIKRPSLKRRINTQKILTIIQIVLLSIATLSVLASCIINILILEDFAKISIGINLISMFALGYALSHIQKTLNVKSRVKEEKTD